MYCIIFLKDLSQFFYRRYLDAFYILLKPNDHLKYFQGFRNFCHITVSFSMETEEGEQIIFSQQ